MKPQKIIDNYCRLYGVTMPALDLAETQYFVTISPAGAQAMCLHKSSRLMGRVVGEAMKRGTVLYVHNGWVKVLTWENWKKTWHKLFEPEKRNTAPEPNRISPQKYEIFDTMRQERPRKKPQKHGFERTFLANRNMNLLPHPVTAIHAEYL